MLKGSVVCVSLPNWSSYYLTKKYHLKKLIISAYFNLLFKDVDCHMILLISILPKSKRVIDYRI